MPAHNAALAGDTLTSLTINYQWRKFIAAAIDAYLNQSADDEQSLDNFDMLYSFYDDFYNFEATPAMKSTTRLQSLGANRSTTSTIFVAVTGSDFVHNFTKPNALIICTAQLHMNIAATGQIRPAIVGFNGADSTVGQITETTPRNITFSETFNNITLGNQTVRLEWKVSASTINMNNGTAAGYTIIEYD